MALGTFADLTNAANGIFKPRVTPPPTPGGGDPQQQLYDARRERSRLAQSAAERVSSTISALAPSGNYSPFYSSAVSPTVSDALTPTYSNIISQYSRSPYGLSNKGKYGGFYNASDQEAAIRGSAESIVEQVPVLRSIADQRFADVEKAYWDALGSAQNKYLQANPLPERSVRAMEEVQGGRVPGLREYFPKLGSWYQENVAPAQEYLRTASQIETTPISDLAQQIAVSAYGMNPEQARGKFGVDLSSDTAMKDYNFKRLYGKTYQEIDAEMKKQTELFGPKAQAETYKQALESLTGMPIAQLQSSSGRAPAELYSAVTSGAEIPYKGKDSNGTDISGNYAPSALFSNFMAYINAGDYKKAEEWMNAASNAGNRVLADLMYGIVNKQVDRRKAGQQALQWGQSQQSDGGITPSLYPGR